SVPGVEQAGQSRGQGAAAEMNRNHGKLSASTFKKLPLSHFVYSPVFQRLKAALRLKPPKPDFC
ncbi:MAG: hypothetical protein LBD58_05975, partial [Treponema sp.]|nr:hypothetical protein [Treponema sp.]